MEGKIMRNTEIYLTYNSRKTRRSCSFKYHAACILFEYLFLLAMISLTLGSFESVSEAKCEYEDANLIWRMKPAYSLNDVKAMAWYKGKDVLIATWLEGKGFKASTPYVGRLMQIGETGIKLKNAKRSDSGSYWLSLTLASVDHKLEAVTHFEVIVAPSSKCKPNITEEGTILKAELPAEGCGKPSLTPKWKNTSNTVIQELHHSSFLDLGRDYDSGEYKVCAEGDSARCYKGNISDLCTEHTKPEHRQRDPRLTPDPVSIILPSVLLPLVAALVILVLVLRLKRKRICGTSTDSRQSEIENRTDIDEACPTNEIYPLIEKGENIRKDFLPKYLEIQNHLRGLYKGMTSVSVSPTGIENFVEVSEVYVDLDFQQMETTEMKSTETCLSCTSSYNTSVSKEDINIAKVHIQSVSPTIIAGCRGSGKSTWCKHLVQSWSQNSKHEDANLQGINLPNLGKFQILLYLPLQTSDRGLSFQELLQRYLFQEQPSYLNIIMNYTYDQSQAQSILILIDGFDKIGENVKPILELFDHKLFSSCTVLFTCRPSSFKPILNACIDRSIQLKLFKICEIPLEKSTSYAGNVLSRLKQHDDDLNIKNFLTFTRNLQLQSLLQLPYFCLTLLFLWVENKNPFTEITDILLLIVEHLLDSAKTDRNCMEKITTLLEQKSLQVQPNINKLDQRFVQIKVLMYELSMITEEIWISKSKGLTDKERLFRETSASGKDTLPLEVLHEIGLVTESIPLISNESLSSFTFTNVLIYQLFVSMAIAFKKGYAFDYIVSDMEVALKHSMIIHMLRQFSPTLGKEIFVEMGKLKTKKFVNRGMGQHNKKVRYFISERSKINKYLPVEWLQLLMYKGDLDDEKLLFLTNALRSMDSLTSLELENNENNDDLVFWLPCSQSLKKLTLNISNCTLLLCPEWNKQLPLKLKEVVIKSVNINSRDLEVLCNALKSCKHIKKQEMCPEIMS